jgi:hypothetical protein
LQDQADVTDNAAVLQQRVTKASNQFLATLAEPGESQFLTVLKPCGILLPHTHQRANEFYSVIFGALHWCPLLYTQWGIVTLNLSMFLPSSSLAIVMHTFSVDINLQLTRCMRSIATCTHGLLSKLTRIDT